MVEPIDPVDRICNYARELYVRSLVARKLAQLSQRLEQLEEMKLVAKIIDYLIDDISFEAADIYSTRCKEKVKQVLREVKEEVENHER